MKTITVTISPTGKTQIEAHGYKGQGCAKATEFLEKALGTATTTTKKPEATQGTCSAAATLRQTT